MIRMGATGANGGNRGVATEISSVILPPVQKWAGENGDDKDGATGANGEKRSCN